MWLTSFEYIRGLCALYEFANATCNQEPLDPEIDRGLTSQWHEEGPYDMPSTCGLGP